MEYTLFNQICAIALVLTFIWQKLVTGMNLGKRVRDMNIPSWRLSPLYLLLNQGIALFILWGTGFFYEWHWPQIVWSVCYFFSIIFLMIGLAALRSGVAGNKELTYGGGDFLGDAIAILIYCFGHAYGPLGLNPWPV